MTGAEGDGQMAESTGVSAFGAGGVPSAARVSAALRDMAADPAVDLGGATVEHLCDRLRAAATFLGDLDLIDGVADLAAPTGLRR